jgi:oligopeptide transport system ATP-binding protein
MTTAAQGGDAASSGEAAATGAPSGDVAAPALEVRDLVRHFTARGGAVVRAVDGVSLTVGRGEVVGLVGESGSGKSTVGRCVVRLDDPTGGTVRIGGTDVTHLSRRRLRPLRKDFNIVFQDPSASLDPRMRVRRIVGEPLALHGTASGAALGDRVAELLRQVGLPPGTAERRPHELSGGQRQRVAIARALSVDPMLLVADEPTSALDVSVQASVLNLLADLQRDRGFGCLFITHDLAAVEFLADRIAVMYLGEIVEVAPAAELFAAPKHPYTQALLSAVPVPDPPAQRARQRIVLHGDLAGPVFPKSGGGAQTVGHCRFHTRCPLAFDRCRTQAPEHRTLPGPGPDGSGAGRMVACHLVEDDGTAPDAAAPPPGGRPAATAP